MRRRLDGRVVALERASSGEELERDARERVPVTRRRARLPACLLRRHVAGRAEHRPGGGEGVVPGRPGDPEVGDPDRAVLRDEEVGGLHVAVDDPARMRPVERVGRLLEPRERPLRLDPPRAEAIGDRAARDVLHHDERQVVAALADVVDHDHVRLAREAGGGPRLPHEAGVELLVPRVALREHLHGDRPT